MNYQPSQPISAVPATPGKAADPYLKTRVMTATPEQLQLMLFDGAIRFAEQGRVALGSGTFDQSYEKLSKAQKIVNELEIGLRPEHDPVNCERIKGLYTFVYMRLVDANVNHETAAVDDALSVLRYQRETWMMLLKQRQADAGAAGETAGQVGPVQPRPRLSLAG